MNRITKGRSAFCLETIELKEKLELDFLELGRRLVEIYSRGLWEGMYSSYEEFLFDARVSRATDSKLRRIYCLMVREYRFSPAKIAKAGGWTMIAEVLPAIKNKESAEKWLDLASRLERVDLRRTFKEEQTGVDMMTCRHVDSYVIRICRECGLRTQELEGKLLENEKNN